MPNYSDLIGNTRNPISDEELQEMSVVDGMFTNESVVLVHAASKVGKTWWAIKLASCIACGKDFFGHSVADIDKILYINGELSTRMLARRFKMIAEREGTSPECVEEVVDIISTRDCPDFNLHECLAEIGKDYGLVIVDPAYVIYPDDTFDENSNKDVVKMLTKVGNFVQSNRVPVLIVHHNKKGTSSATSFDVASGAGAYGRYASTIVTLTSQRMAVVCRDFPGYEKPVVVEDKIHWQLREDGVEYNEKLEIEVMIQRLGDNFTSSDLQKRFRKPAKEARELLDDALERGIIYKRTEKARNGRMTDYYHQVRS